MGKIYKICKKIKIRNLVILLLLLTFNTYAWFIYVSKVSTELTVSVSSWNVEFSTSGGEASKELIIDVGQIYPGMEDFEEIIEVRNKGQTKAKLSYEIKSLKIMDEFYEVTEDSGLTSENIENKIDTEYPFKISVEMDDSGLAVRDGIGIFRIKVVWPYESGNDELDTLWGNKAYEFYEKNPDDVAIELKIELVAKQLQE